METHYYTVLHEAQERHWWYQARRQILGDVLADLVRRGLPEGTIYDLGCGVGANLPLFERFGRTVGVDSSPEAVAYCRSRGHENAHQADLNTLRGLPPGSGKIAVLADVIEHLDDEHPALAAAAELLAPGGALVVTVPAYMFLWGPSDEINHHKRRYTERQLREVVARHLPVERSTYFNTLLFPLVAAGRIAEKVLRRPGDETSHVPAAPVNGALRAIFAAERPWLARARFPLGVSILCVARKPR